MEYLLCLYPPEIDSRGFNFFQRVTNRLIQQIGSYKKIARQCSEIYKCDIASIFFVTSNVVETGL